MNGNGARKLVLLDIDGTLLLTRASGRRSMASVVSEIIGRPAELDAISFSGKTDRQIIREILHVSGVDRDRVQALMDEVVSAYRSALPRHLQPDHITVLPGVRELVQALHEQTELQLGLLTGNLHDTAYLKLRLVGLADFFPFGAFGSDHEDRNALPEVAMRRAREMTGHTYDPGRVFVVGDTPQDVACGRVGGCRTIAVCTGRVSWEELAAHAPDLLVRDFEDYQRVVDFICRDAS